jgi:hypothetical protein
MPPAFNTLTDRARLATFGLRYHRAVEVACPTLHCSSTTEYFQTKPFCRAESPARCGGNVILRNEANFQPRAEAVEKVFLQNEPKKSLKTLEAGCDSVFGGRTSQPSPPDCGAVGSIPGKELLDVERGPGRGDGRDPASGCGDAKRI